MATSDESTRATFTVVSQIDGRRFRMVLREGELAKLRADKIKTYLAKSTGIPVSEQVLRVKGVVLADDATGAEFGLQDGMVIALLRKSEAPPAPPTSEGYATDVSRQSGFSDTARIALPTSDPLLSQLPASSLGSTYIPMPSYRSADYGSTAPLSSAGLQSQASPRLPSRMSTNLSSPRRSSPVRRTSPERMSPTRELRSFGAPSADRGSDSESERRALRANISERQRSVYEVADLKRKHHQELQRLADQWEAEKATAVRNWTSEKKQLLTAANEDREKLLTEIQRLRKQLGESGSEELNWFEEKLELQNICAAVTAQRDALMSEIKLLKRKWADEKEEFVRKWTEEKENWMAEQRQLTRGFEDERQQLLQNFAEDKNRLLEQAARERAHAASEQQRLLAEGKRSQEQFERDRETMLKAYSGERDDWGTERQKLLDAVQVEKKQWHEEREQLMKNWAEESEILTQLYKEDKGKWDEERTQLISSYEAQLKEHIDEHGGVILELEENLKFFTMRVDEQEAELVKLREQCESAKTLAADATQRAEVAAATIAELQQALSNRAGGQEIAQMVVAATQEKNTIALRETQLRREVESLVVRLRDETSARKSLHNQLEDSKGRIRVVCRCRPPLHDEPGRGYEEGTIECVGDSVVVTTLSNGAKSFDYYRVLGPTATQFDVFNEVRPLVQSALDGYNVGILAYGQTGSGKTYTILGTPQHPGVVPRALEELFGRLLEAGTRSDIEYTVTCSMLELYLDTLRDLLATDTQKLEIRQRVSGESFVQGATSHTVADHASALKLLAEGTQLRQTAATRLNEQSSRSHTIFVIDLEVNNLRTGSSTRSKLCFVDLAGSERVSKSQSTGDRFKEAQAINKSLSALGDVVASLSSNEQHVPYRNSKLTMLLQDFIGGNSKTLLFANISPTNISETASTLGFASRVKLVRNGPVRAVSRARSTSVVSNTGNQQ